jgi:hypothetical protein
MLNSFDFAKVVSDKKLKGSGIQRGEVVFISSLKQLPEKKSDPYLTRTYVLVFKLGEDDVPLVPKEENDYQAIMVDPRNLEKVSDEEQAYYMKLIEERYSGES